MANVVLVVDMLNDFFEPKHPLYVGGSVRKIILHIQNLLDVEVERGTQIVFLCDRHAAADAQLQIFAPHCTYGTRGAEIIPELRRYGGYDVPKRSPNGFLDTILLATLTWLKPDKLIICGVCTEKCVLQTATTARNYGYEVEIPTDCVSSPDAKAHHIALRYMEDLWKIKVVAGRKEGEPYEPEWAGARHMGFEPENEYLGGVKSK